MRGQARENKDSWALELLEAGGRDVREFGLEEVQTYEVEDYTPFSLRWLEDFFRLSTCRAIGMGVGPIPWTAIRQYSEVQEHDENEWRVFEIVMVQMDSVYLTWQAEQQEEKLAESKNRGRVNMRRTMAR